MIIVCLFTSVYCHQFRKASFYNAHKREILIGGRPELDSNDLRGSCRSCSYYYSPLLANMEEVRVHSAPVNLQRANQDKNKAGVRSLGQRRQWLWTHAIYSH